MQILAISGSLRAASTNTTLLKAAAALAPVDVSLNAFLGSVISTLQSRSGPRASTRRRSQVSFSTAQVCRHNFR
jgi:NAD(P)H-dependent FMN reductase